MNDKINIALLDANERLRKENEKLRVELEKTTVRLNESSVNAQAFLKIVAALDTTDCYGILVPYARDPNSTVQGIRANYFPMTPQGIAERIGKLEAAAKEHAEEKKTWICMAQR